LTVSSSAVHPPAQVFALGQSGSRRDQSQSGNTRGSNGQARGSAARRAFRGGGDSSGSTNRSIMLSAGTLATPPQRRQNLALPKSTPKPKPKPARQGPSLADMVNGLDTL
jgi:hypothetical protein